MARQAAKKENDVKDKESKSKSKSQDVGNDIAKDTTIKCVEGLALRK